MSDELNAAIASASADAAKEVETGEPVAEPVAEPEVKADAAEPETKPEPEPKAEPEEEPLNLSAADLELINKSPELQKAYKSMQRGLTKKTQALAESRKNLEERAKVADWIQSDPDAAVETLARMRGKTFAQAKADAVDKVVDGLEAEWIQKVGPGATAVLRPLFENTARELFKNVVEPLKQQTEFLSRAAAERGIAASVAQFGAERAEAGEEWNEEIQAEMAKVMAKVEPGDEANIQEYLGTLYDAVSARRNRARGVKTQLDRLKAAQRDTEPTTTTRPSPKAEERITDDMNDNTAIAMAVKQATAALGR